MCSGGSDGSDAPGEQRQKSTYMVCSDTVSLASPVCNQFPEGKRWRGSGAVELFKLGSKEI